MRCPRTSASQIYNKITRGLKKVKIKISTRKSTHSHCLNIHKISHGAFSNGYSSKCILFYLFFFYICKERGSFHFFEQILKNSIWVQLSRIEFSPSICLLSAFFCCYTVFFGNCFFHTFFFQFDAFLIL